MGGTNKERLLYQRIGRNLRSLLKDRGICPAELARRTHVVKGKMHYVVHGHYCALDVAVLICKSLGITLDELVYGKGRRGKAKKST